MPETSVRLPSSPVRTPIPPPSLASLIPELKFAIFAILPDVPSVKALALSSASFYYTFLRAQSLVLNQVLQNEIHPELMHDALAALQASRFAPWSKEAAQNHLRQYFDTYTSPPSYQWTLSDALALNKLHSYVHFFATDFATLALSLHPVTRIPYLSPSPPSLLELRRTERIFYRFEYYCGLFRERKGKLRCVRFTVEEQQSMFFDGFSPWENEQLGCIHDYLFERLYPPFEEVAEHDVDWGELGINCLSPPGSNENRVIEGYLSHGLAYLYQAITATTYKDRQEVILSGFKSDHLFLYQGLAAASEKSMFEDDEGIVMLKDYKEKEEKLYIHPPLGRDSDSGPEEAWRLAHAEDPTSCFYFLRDQMYLRRRGYVMWDHARLLEWSFLGAYWRDLLSDVPPRFTAGEKERQERSLKERLEIWYRGGRGWWASGDESRICWANTVRPSKATTVISRYESTNGSPYQRLSRQAPHFF